TFNGIPGRELNDERSNARTGKAMKKPRDRRGFFMQEGKVYSLYPTRMPTQPTVSMLLPPAVLAGTSMCTVSFWVVATLKSKCSLGSSAELSKIALPPASASCQF